MSPEQIEEVAKKAAKETIEELFLVLGIDITKKESLLELQKDFTYTRDGRLGKDELIKKSKLTLMGIFVTSVAAIVIKAILGGGIGTN